MKIRTPKPTDVGIIVGRFQVDELHEAHIDLIQSVVDIHDYVKDFNLEEILVEEHVQLANMLCFLENN